MKKKLLMLMLALCMILTMTALSACGGGSGDSSSELANEEAAPEEGTQAADDTEFLMGSWFARTATINGEEADPKDVFNGTFQLYFTEDKCNMVIDTKTAPVSWKLTDEGVTLTGDDTYYITFPDDSKDTLLITIKGVEVLMEKYVE